MALGTVGGGKNPWVSPVVYAYDKNWNFYFVSIPDSRHCLNMRANKSIAMAIFDSKQKLGEGIGLQMEGIVNEVKLTELPKAALIYFKRKYPFGRMRHTFDTALKKLLNDKLYRFYKIIPSKIWINDPESRIDVRIQIRL